MVPRQVLNVVYRHLVAGLSEEDREKLDGDLYASLDGSDSRALSVVQQMGG